MMYLLKATQPKALKLAVVVAQLTARSLPISDDLGSIPVIGNFYWAITYLLLTLCRQDENKEKVLKFRNDAFLCLETL